MRDHNIFVTIAIPFYNSECFLADAIQSVVNQTYINWELLLMDDNGTDGSRKIAEKLDVYKRQGLSFAIDYFINASNLFTLLVEGVLALLVALCVAPIFINAEDLDALDVILPIKTVMRWLNFNWTRQNA